MAVVTALGLLVTACGAGAAPEPVPDPAAGSVTVQSFHGPVTVPAKPQRVVSLLASYTDVALELGATVVGIGDFTGTGALGEAVLMPWQQGRLTVGDDGAKVLGNAFTPIDLEAIAALEPDLILANQHQFPTPETYARMAAIAPTFASIRATSDQDSWQESTLAVGTLLHEREAAERLIAEREQRIASVREAHPGIDGRTAVYVATSRQGIFVVSDPNGPANSLLGDLGFTLPEQVAALPLNTMVSLEQVSTIDADVIFAVSQDGSRMEDLPGWGNLTAVRNGTDQQLDLGGSISLLAPSLLSIDHFLDTAEQTFVALDRVAGR